MNCREAEALMSDLLDDDLPQDAAAAVHAHIDACERCTDEYRALRRTVRFVRGNADTPLVPGSPGAAYDDFTRSIVDDSFGKTPMEVILQFLAPDAPEGRNTR